jgi:hypothetical protein
MKYWIGYLDLLGFKYYTNINQHAALEMLSEYQQIFQNSEEIDEGISQSEGVTYTPAFVHVIPFSDSLFLVGSTGSRFFRGIGRFLNHCWSLKSSAYSHPNDLNNPLRVRIAVVNVNDQGKFVGTHDDELWPPLLFRGGVSYGDAHLLPSSGRINGDKVTLSILSGIGVVDAVSQEHRGKGPRLFLSKKSLDYFRLTDDFSELGDAFFAKVEHSGDSDLYEFLWPAVGDVSSLIEMLQGAVNLWNANSHDISIAVQYWEFVRLIVRSADSILTGSQKDSFDSTVDRLNIRWRLDN